FFIECKAGRGKSFTAGIIINRHYSERHIVLVVGSTTLSVAKYERIRPVHSEFVIHITQNDMELQSPIALHSQHARFLPSKQLPMSNWAVIEYTNSLFQLLTGNSRPFVGKIVAGISDLEQVVPVMRNCIPIACLDPSIRSSFL
ncbi:hypothetical protein HOY80DRAFT_890408, partial [Tuber brumale]